jgi:hypothetical protein
MTEPTQPAPRIRGPGFPVVTAVVWVSLLTAATVWSLHPEWWSTAEGAAFYRQPDTGAPTRTFEMLARVGMFFVAVLWPMLLLKRGFWRPWTRAAAMRAATAPPRRFGSPEWFAAAVEPEPDERTEEEDDDDEYDDGDEDDGDGEDEEDQADAADDSGPTPPESSAPTQAGAVPEGAAASGELLGSGSTTFTPVDSVTSQSSEPTPQESRRESHTGRFARTADPGIPGPRLDSVGPATALLQLVVLALIAFPFWVLASYLSDVDRARLLDTGLVIGSFGLLHVGYASATRGWARPPDRFYVLGLILLTVGWSWINSWTVLFAMPGLGASESVANFSPMMLIDRVAVTGLAGAAAGSDTAAAFWPAGAGVLLFLASFLTARD